MPDFPHLTILINTFRRNQSLIACIDALQDNIVYPRDLITWAIADDCSGGHYMQEIRERYRSLEFKIYSTWENSGWGASANNALQHVTTPYTYHTDDDFILKQPLDLEISVALLETVPTIGMLRYAALACSERYLYRQHEADVSAWVNEPISGTLKGRLVYLTIEKESPSLYLYSQTPLLYSPRWFPYYGKFPTGVTLGEGEEKYCHHVKDMMNADDNAPTIAVLPDWINDRYEIRREHSWQFTEFDVRHEVQA